MDIICTWCGAKTIAPETCQDVYYKLSFYTLNHPNPEFFIHQLIVDAYGAQHASEHTKPIGVAFALIGLYLFSEKNYTGREVQLMHMQLAKTKRNYPSFQLPKNRGNLTVVDVLKVNLANRDEMIKKWAKSVWQAFIASRQQVIQILAEANINDK